MKTWLQLCRDWLEQTYSRDLIGGHQCIWVDENELRRRAASPDSAGALALIDEEIGWLFFFLPFSKGADIGSRINQALSARAWLAREANYTGKPTPGSDEDEDGWQVGLVWLVAESDDTAWQAEMALLRHESGASEELSLDRILIAGDDVAASLDTRGLPRLLLATRQLLRKRADEAEQWLSADAQVAAKLAGFVDRFRNNPLARRHARWLVEQAVIDNAAAPALGEPQQFDRFSVWDYRNLQSLDVSAPDKGLGSIVLFGPNGTGKSGFIEALSLAVFHRSPRSDRYLEDKDDTRRSGDRFRDWYATPLKGGRRPTYRLGNGATQSFEVLTADAKDPDGVILDQDNTITDLSGDKLAARVLRGYSELAQRLDDELGKRLEAAKQEKTRFFHEYNLNAAITKTDTAYRKLAESVLAQVRPIPSGFPDWADQIAILEDPAAVKAKELADRWRQFQAVPCNTADALAKIQALGTEAGPAIKEVLDHYNRLANETRALLDTWAQRYAELKQAEGEVARRMDTWGDFLARPHAPEQATAEADAVRKELETLARERADVERRGRETSARLELLEKASTYLSGHWTGEHSDTCPVCASHLDEAGGIESVVRALASECRRERDELRARYALLAKRQQELEGRLKAQSVALCPIPAAEQDRLRAWLAPFLGRDTLEVCLADRQRREQLKADLRLAIRLLPRPEIYPDTGAEAQRMALEFQRLCENADTVLAEPHALDEVRKGYQGILRAVMDQHLPATLGRVWGEIAHCLAPAPWLLPEQPAMRLAPGRGHQGHRLTLEAGESGRLARYLYNAAELHTLGLAWFFTLHLARRRFEHAWIAMDDPAQDMDQTSFRELTRFWATWLRLHRRNRLPHTLLIALHQEERALEAARATNAELYLLGWRSEQTGEGPAGPGMRKMVQLTPGYFPRTPAGLFKEFDERLMEEIAS